MYSVNIGAIEGYEVIVAKGNPTQRAENNYTVFESELPFELHITKNGRVLGEVTPGKREL